MRGPYVDQRAQELRTLAAKIAADLYQDGKPPTPFDTTMLGYADTPIDGPAVRLMQDDLPAMAGRWRGSAWYIPDQQGMPVVEDEPIDAAEAAEMERLMRANVLANAAQRPDVNAWAIFDAEEGPDGRYTLRCWLREYATITSMPVRQGTWAELFPPLLPATKPIAPYRFPATLPQQTSPEIKAVTRAIADGPTGRRWTQIEGETALAHRIGNTRLETKLLGLPLLDWLGLPNTPESIYVELRTMGLDAVLLLHDCIGAVLDQTGHAYVTATMDELIRAIGWTPRSKFERDQKRRQVWRWLAMFTAMEVIGTRTGRYKDKATGEAYDLTSRDPLLVLAGRRMAAQLAFDDSQPPIEVTLGAGAWLDRWRGNAQVLWYFGDVRKLAAIPAGKPSGAWARSIGLALQQRWREESATAGVAHVGEQNKVVTFTGPFTRAELLDLFPPSPTLDEMLAGPNPARARAYWKDAIGLLKEQGTIGYYREQTRLAAGRQEWAAEWKAQEINIEPPADSASALAIAEIASRAKTARKARAKRKASPPRYALDSINSHSFE